MNEMNNTLELAYREVSGQIAYYLDQLPNECYAMSLPLLSGNSIGKHFRHILEIVETLASGSNVVCYDKRERKVLYEQSKEAFLARFDELNTKLFQREWNESLQIKHDPAPGNLPLSYYTSSFGRELLYNLEHIIHHLAIIKLASLSIDHGHCVPEKFGIAFSTLYATNA